MILFKREEMLGAIHLKIPLLGDLPFLGFKGINSITAASMWQYF